MGEGTRRLRLRAVLASWFTVLAVVAVVVVLVGGWATYAVHVDPGTAESTTEEVAWSLEGSFDHSAEVTGDTPVFESGTTISDRSTYFLAASPVLDGNFTAQYQRSGGEPAEMHLEAELVQRAVEDDTVLWADRTTLASTEEPDVQPGEVATVAFSFNASRAMERRENITTALGGSPGELETFVAVDVVASSPAQDEPEDVTYTAKLPVTFGNGVYSIGSPNGASERVTYTTTEAVPREYGPLLGYGGPFVLLLGLVGLVGLGTVRSRTEALELTPEEREILEYRDERAEFDEWVVRAELPDSVLDRETSTAASFADLVDFAIDANGSVIEEPASGQYYAVTSDLLVTYRPPEPIDGDT